MDDMNRIWNAANPNQGAFKKVLCVCSAGLLRSPTTALVLSQAPYNYNTRAAGIDTGHALIPVDDVLLIWADEIVCMNSEQKTRLNEMMLDKPKSYGMPKPIVCLHIPDSYEYRDPKLIKLIKANYPARGL